MNTLFPFLRRPLLVIAGFSLVVNLLLLVPAIFMLQVFDRVLSSQSGSTLALLLLGTLLALGLLLTLDYLRARLQGVAGAIVTESLTPLVARVAVAQGAQRSGRASNEALRDVAAVRALFSAQGLIALFDAPWAVVYVLVIGLAHVWLGVAAALAAVLMLGLAVLNDRLTRQPIDALQQASAGAQRELEAALVNAEVAHALGMTDALVARWQRRQAEVTRLQQPVAVRGLALAAITRTFRQGVQVLMLALGAWLVISGEATAGVMIATTTLLGRALAPVEQVVGSWRSLAEGRAALGRLRLLLGDADQAPPRMQLPRPTGHLSAQGLVFRPPGTDRLLLGGVSFALPAGESLAIIGPSGAGKSTLVRLLTGVWTPSAGTVRLDGADMGLWPRDDLGRHIGYLPQDVELFQGTVAENIARMGRVDADRVLAAAHLAGVHEMVLALPDGYDTRVDPASALLSPGQRQRLGLARALYGEPRLVLLDEPNANLDGAGEAALATTLRQLKGKATVIVVTHRSTLTQHVDRMLVLEGGRAVHFGPREQVLQAMQQGQRPLGAAAQAVAGRPSASLPPAAAGAVPPAVIGAAAPATADQAAPASGSGAIV